MSKSILGLRTCIYKVSDLDKAKAWYTEAFETPPYFDEPYYVGFNIGGYELGLMPDETPAASKVANILTYWGVNDVPATLERIQQLGATLQEAPMDVGDGIIVATVQEEWGNTIGFIYNPIFKAE